MIPDSYVEQLKYATDIEAVISSYVQLKRRGRNLTGLCPFHSEKSPSFTVYPDSQSYFCFGCGSGGDIITFVRNIENLEYIEALKLLSDRAGMTMPENDVDDSVTKMKARVLEINRETARFYHKCLCSENGKNAMSYLTNRGLTGKTIRSFGLGFSPEGWDNLRNHLRKKSFNDEEMLAAAVVTKGRNGGVYDTFRGRAMFPIIDLRGNVIGFGGRAMGDGGPKYINSADTPVFKKSRNLFALNFAKATKSDTLILAEGYMDVIAIHQAGFDNAVATLGTALTDEQARLISSYTRKIAIAYDSDGAGQAATKRAINLLGKIDVSVTVLDLGESKDPDEFIKKNGPQRFEKLIVGGKGAIAFEIDKLKASFSIGDAEGKSAFLSEFCKFMAGIDSELERDVYISTIARELEVGKQALELTIKSERKRRKNAKNKQKTHNLKVYAQDNAGIPQRNLSEANLEGFVAEEKLITLLLKNPDSYESIVKRISVDDIMAEDHKAIFTAITGRLAENLSAEPIYLSSQLNPTQMSRLSRLMATAQDIPFYPGQAEEYCTAIIAQKNNRTRDEVDKMTPEEYSKYITSLLAKKK